MALPATSAGRAFPPKTTLEAVGLSAGRVGPYNWLSTPARWLNFSGSLAQKLRARGSWPPVYALLSDDVLATVLLDRLLHHAHVVNIRGQTYRLRDRLKAGLQPVPLADIPADT